MHWKNCWVQTADYWKAAWPLLLLFLTFLILINLDIFKPISTLSLISSPVAGVAAAEEAGWQIRGALWSGRSSWISDDFDRVHFGPRPAPLWTQNRIKSSIILKPCEMWSVHQIKHYLQSWNIDISQISKDIYHFNSLPCTSSFPFTSQKILGKIRSLSAVHKLFCPTLRTFLWYLIN